MDKKFKKEKTKRISFDIPFKKHYEIKMAALTRGITIKQLIENALYAYAQMNQNEK